jgi:hypothetical protein
LLVNIVEKQMKECEALVFQLATWIIFLSNE